MRGDDPNPNRTWGQCFYKMAAGVRPQWIRTFPVPEAPHTGDGLFEGEVIEVVQVRFPFSRGGVVGVIIGDQ